mgnify:CR=1 FL=1
MAGTATPHETLGAYPIRISSRHNCTTAKAGGGLTCDARVCVGGLDGDRHRTQDNI